MASGSSSRIEELQRRLAKDPNSKIFAQLAEEYRKGGQLEEAVRTCREGLKKHPNYFSARVALGRALMESGALEEASQEFERVLAQIPDNILANRFLGETYYELGRGQDALLKFRIAHTLAPDDTELIDRINQLEDELTASEAPPRPAPAAVLDENAIEFAEPELHEEPRAPTVTPPEFAPEGEEIFEFEDDDAGRFGVIGSGPEAPRPEPEGGPSERSGLSSAAADREPPTSSPEQDRPHPPSPPEPEMEWPSELDLPGESGSFAEPDRTPIWEASEELGPWSPVAPEPSASSESFRPPPPAGPAEGREGVTTVTLAELYASQGHLDRALSVYRSLLSSHPGDAKLRERVEELEILVQAAEPDVVARTAAPPQKDPDTELLRETIRKLEGWLAAISRF